MKKAGQRMALIGVALCTPLASASARGDALALDGPSAQLAADSAPAGSRTALCDLSGFRAIAVDTLKLAQTGDLEAARKRIRDLEESWEQAAPKMKPLAPAKWEAVDAAIDPARRELRFWRARRTDSVEALQALISTIDSV